MSSGDSLEKSKDGKLSLFRRIERFGWNLAMRHDLLAVNKVGGKPSHVNRMYDFLAPIYDVFFRRLESFRAGGSRLVQRVARPSDRILDLGTGTGINLGPCLQVSPRVIGLDLSGKMLGQARKWAHKEKKRVELVQGNALALPFRDESFDCVIAAYMLVYLNRDQLLSCLREVHRILVPEGRFGVLCGQGERSPRNPRRDDWVDLCYQAGFSRVDFDDFFDVLRIVDVRK